ncbi:MAG TPA: Fur family transcriptional regulator [Acidimicrobiales bacterium]|nr:Fur family transcriptional regulator [Acidimicrobiales bacterium]
MNGTSPSADEIMALLRSGGGRMTASRRAVVDVLLDGDHHLTADEIVARVTARHPEVHRSTVYRTLERLQEIGVLSHVHLGHGPSTFHLVDRPHHHAVCSSCGAVVEVPFDALDSLAGRLRREHGFELAPQHFALSGLCRDCRAGDPPGRISRRARG